MNQPAMNPTPAWWQHDRVLLRRKILALAPVFEVFALDGAPLLYVQQKLFKLKEDIRVYADATRSRELLTIKARQIIDFSAAYDVIDSSTGERVGALRRKGFSSIVRDSWEFLDPSDAVIGRMQEDGLFWLRRLLTNLVPQQFSISLGERVVGSIQQRFNPFVFKAELDLSADPDQVLDRRLALAAGILMMAIEGRQG